MAFFTGSASGDRDFRRQLHFFEPMALSLVVTVASYSVPGWAVNAIARPMLLALVLLGWGWLRLRPLTAFVTLARPHMLARRPLVTMIAGTALLLPIVAIAARLRWGSWRMEGLSVILLVAVMGGLPLGASYWEDRFGRKARHARRRMLRESRSAA